MSNRKLQAEIDRTLKKISEGIEIFDGIIEKLHGNISNNQKEKLELELKKEIKKLQRQRDQIKNWLATNEVKDKDILLETRRLIELQMEKFKVCEKEMKTKAYSKEGLSQVSKLDPREKEKVAMANWLTSAVDRLFTQVNMMEAELESLELSIKKTKKPESSKVERQQLLEKRIESHKVHMDKLEILLRMLENGNLGVDKLSSFKDDMDYYIESNGEPDFVEDLAMYDDFDLTEQTDGSDSESEFISDQEEEKRKEEITEKPKSFAKTAAPPAAVTVPKATTKSPPLPTNVKKTAVSVPSTIQAPQPVVEIINPAQVWSNAPKSIILEPPKDKKKMDIKVESIPHKPEPSFSEVLASGLNSFASVAGTHTAHEKDKSETNEDVKSFSSQFLELKNSFEELKVKQQGNAKSEMVYYQQAIENSFMNIPDSIELDRSRRYHPKSPCGVPSYYPLKPPVIFENPSIFERFDIDTLFFIFYYQQKTLQQYFAARELKKQSWRFHKKYLTWFQRHEEPKAITDEYEQGTYIYFDYEGSWCQRKKTEFTFEYRYLEDAELV